MKQFVKTGLVGIFAVGALVGCDKANFESRHDYIERKAAEKQQELFEKMPQLQVTAAETPADFAELKKGVYATRFIEEGDTLRYLVNVVQTTHMHKNVVVTGGEGDTKSLSERFSGLSAKDLTPVNLPAESLELAKGQYEITVAA